MEGEKRKQPRIDYRLKASIFKDGVKLNIQIHDISESGMSFVSENDFLVGELLEMKLDNLAELGVESLECSLRIQHVLTLNAQKKYGCRFEVCNDEFQRFIRELQGMHLSSRAQIFRDLISMRSHLD